MIPTPSLIMAYLHCPTLTQILTRIWTSNPMATLYNAEHVNIAWIWIPIQTQIVNHYCTNFWDDIRTHIGIRLQIRQCK